MTPSMNIATYREKTFLKAVKVENGTIKFTHQKKDYHIEALCLNILNGLTVLVDAGFNIFRGDKQIGIGTPVA